MPTKNVWMPHLNYFEIRCSLLLFSRYRCGGDGSVFQIEKQLADMVSYAKQKQTDSGVKLLWGTANVFSNPRYMNGASPIRILQ